MMKTRFIPLLIVTGALMTMCGNAQPPLPKTIQATPDIPATTPAPKVNTAKATYPNLLTGPFAKNCTIALKNGLTRTIVVITEYSKLTGPAAKNKIPSELGVKKAPMVFEAQKDLQGPQAKNATR